MNRRLALMGCVSPLALAACGFKLRQAQEFAFASLQYNGPSTPVSLELRRLLQANGVQLNPPPVAPGPDQPPRASADVVMEVQQDRRERAVVGQTAAGQVRELQLRQRFQFRLRTRDGRDLIASEELLQTRDISFTETAVLSKDAEEALMYKDMLSDLVQQILRRLASVKL